MSLTILNDVTTEETRNSVVYASGTNVVSSSTYAASGVHTAISSALTGLGVSPYTGTGSFTQYAEKTNFVSSSNQVSDYFLSAPSGNALAGVATNIYVGGNEVFLYSTGDPNVVVGLIGNATNADATGAVAMVIALDETKSGGLVTSANLWINLYAPLVEAGHNLEGSSDVLNLSGLISLGSNYNTITEVPFSDFSKVPSGNNTFDVIFPTGVNTDVQLLVTGVAGSTEKSVTVSTQGIGAGSQSVTTGTSIRIDTVSGVVQSTVDSNSECVPSHLVYTQHVGVDAASFQITQTNPTHHLVDINISALSVGANPQQQAFIDDAVANEGALVHIAVSDVRIFSGTTDVTATFGGTITQVGDTVTITNLANNMLVRFNTEGVNFDRMLIHNSDSSDTFDVGNITVTTVTGGSNTEYSDLGGHTIFQDDGPVIAASGTAVPTLTVHDSSLGTDSHTSFAGLFTSPDYGADGAATVTYSLGVKNNGTNVVSGLFDTLTGQSIVLNYDSGTKTVIGTTVTSHDTVFTISVDANGNVNLDQARAIQHSNTSSSSETASLSAADLVTLTATITDGEASSHNDSATATVSIGASFVFTDDGPSLTPQAVPSDNNLVLGNVTSGATSTDSSSYGLVPGGDGMPTGGYTIVGPADSSGDFQWTYNDLSHTSITETYKGSNLFSLSLASDGTYTATMLGTIASTPLPLDANYIKAGGPTGSIDVGTTGGSGDFVLITGTSSGSLGAVNASNGNVGVNNGNLDPGEALTFQLFTDSTNTTLIPLHGMDIGTKTAQSATYHITGIDHATGNPVDLGFQTVGKNGTIHVNYGSGFLDSITVAETSGSAIKIGLSGITLLTPPSDYTFNYAVQLADGDGDTATRSFTLSLDGNNDGHITSAVTAAAATLSSKPLATSTSSTFSTFDHHSMLSPFVDYHHHDYFMM